jgi:hypothetical protein
MLIPAAAAAPKTRRNFHRARRDRIPVLKILTLRVLPYITRGLLCIFSNEKAPPAMQ